MQTIIAHLSLKSLRQSTERTTAGYTAWGTRWPWCMIPAPFLWIIELVSCIYITAPYLTLGLTSLDLITRSKNKTDTTLESVDEICLPGYSKYVTFVSESTNEETLPDPSAYPVINAALQGPSIRISGAPKFIGKLHRRWNRIRPDRLKRSFRGDVGTCSCWKFRELGFVAANPACKCHMTSYPTSAGLLNADQQGILQTIEPLASPSTSYTRWSPPLEWFTAVMGDLYLHVSPRARVAKFLLLNPSVTRSFLGLSRPAPLSIDVYRYYQDLGVMYTFFFFDLQLIAPRCWSSVRKGIYKRCAKPLLCRLWVRECPSQLPEILLYAGIGFVRDRWHWSYWYIHGHINGLAGFPGGLRCQ